MLANATVGEWYKQHGRHPVYAKNRPLDLPEYDSPLTSKLPEAPGYVASLNEQGKLIGSPNQVEAVMSNLQKRAPAYAD